MLHFLLRQVYFNLFLFMNLAFVLLFDIVVIFDLSFSFLSMKEIERISLIQYNV